MPEQENAEPTKADEIAETVLEDPWATHQVIAERIGTSRPYVSETVSERSGLQAVRETFQEGIVLDEDLPNGPYAENLAELLERRALMLEDAGERYAQQEAARAILDGRVARVRIELLPENDDD